jgi:hypothetical protein
MASERTSSGERQVRGTGTPFRSRTEGRRAYANPYAIRVGIAQSRYACHQTNQSHNRVIDDNRREPLAPGIFATGLTCNDWLSFT